VPLPDILVDRLALPVMAAPMFIVSGLDLVKAQCKAGIVGSFPALNARPQSQLNEWLMELKEDLAGFNARNITQRAAPFAVNLIVHKSNDRVEQDLKSCVDHKVPIVITSMGVRKEVIDAVHAYGGIVFHDVVNVKFARKAAEFRVDGLIAVASGAGGHAGTISPIALIQELRSWFAGPLALSGSIATGRAILAAEVLGADLAYIGSAFIATSEANAAPEYKRMIVEGSADDIVYTPLFSGVSANYLKPSIRAVGLDPANLPTTIPEVSYEGGVSRKAWKDIWGAGQGIGGIAAVESAGELVDRLRKEYHAVRRNISETVSAKEDVAT
jgi:nitronate monooxygenase